jgi:hypothetical protein
MHRAIHLDAELCRSAVEIEDVRSDRVLTAEVQVLAAEQEPKDAFRLRHGATQVFLPARE